MSAILQTGIGLGQASASRHQNVKGTVPSSTLPAASSEHSSQLAFQITQLLPVLADQAQKGFGEADTKESERDPAGGFQPRSSGSGGEGSVKNKGRSGIHQSRHLVSSSPVVAPRPCLVAARGLHT